MKAYLALVSREIHERRALLAAAAVASLLPLLAPLLPSTGSNPASDIREAVMWVVLGGLAPLFALLLGVSFIGRDLSEGRMGFYYAQPLSGPTIWFGKLTAVVLLLWIVEIVIMLPTVLLAPDPLHFILLPNILEPFVPKWLAPLVFWIASVAVVLLAHAIGVVWRARSAWLMVDLIAFLMVAGVGWLALSPFLPLVAPEVGIAGLLWLVASALAGLIAGGAVQVSKGRVDLRRCHRTLSATLWAILGVSSVLVLGWSAWIRSATIEDLRAVVGISVGSGDWIAVDGVSDGRLDYYPRFLFDVKNGRSVAIGPSVNWNRFDLAFSADGSRVLWAEYAALDQWPLMFTDLEVADPEPAFTGMVLGRDWEDVAVSPDGALFAVLDDRTVAVYRIDPPGQLMAAHIDGRFDPFHLRFDDSNSVRILASIPSKELEVDERWRLFFLDIETRRLVESPPFEMVWRWGSRSLDGTFSDNLARIERDGEDHLVILNPDTGEVAADFGLAPYWSGLQILQDGRIAVTQGRNGNHHIVVFTADGSLIHRIDLPEAEEIHRGGEVAPDRFLFGVVNWEGEMPHRTSKQQTSLVDLKTGKAETILQGYAPVLGRWGWWSGVPGAWDVGAVAGRLVMGEDGSLQLWDPETNQLRQIIPVSD